MPRTVWLLGLISLVNDGASDLIDPLLPLYLTSVLLAGPRALAPVRELRAVSVGHRGLEKALVADLALAGERGTAFG